MAARGQEESKEEGFQKEGFEEAQEHPSAPQVSANNSLSGGLPLPAPTLFFPTPSASSGAPFRAGAHGVRGVSECPPEHDLDVG